MVDLLPSTAFNRQGQYACNYGNGGLLLRKSPFRLWAMSVAITGCSSYSLHLPVSTERWPEWRVVSIGTHWFRSTPNRSFTTGTPLALADLRKIQHGSNCLPQALALLFSRATFLSNGKRLRCGALRCVALSSMHSGQELSYRKQIARNTNKIRRGHL